MSKKTTTENFKAKARLVHGDRYDYSKSIYIHSKTKMLIRCTIHDIWFSQSANSHLNKHGCPECGKDAKKLTKIEFISRSEALFEPGKYTYDKVVYINSYTKVIITCTIHGDFTQEPSMHLNGNECPKCADDLRRLTNEKFIRKSELKHGKLYDYSYVEYINAHSKVKIRCTKHGFFETTATSHLGGSGCPECNASRGEVAISVWLSGNNIDFKSQYSYVDLKGKRKSPLKFDFYIPSLNILIEFDGEHHFKPVKFGGSEDRALKKFEQTKRNDFLKNDYCKKNKIQLLRIHYKDIKRISEILSENILKPVSL
jgi:Zn finger protein HypA/HybF involved in hydrogenase expression